LAHIDPNRRSHFPAAFDERATLTQLLRYVRLTVHAKCVDLSDSDAVQTPLLTSPAMSIAAALLDEYAAQTAHTDEIVASRDWD
jgi:hypothetical protein